MFAPFDNLGLVILDEEQEHTYKSESSPRYHARDVAKFRCAYHKTLLVLASATPSIESYYYAQTGRYTLNQLPHRYGGARLPKVRFVDMNRELEAGNDSIYSRELLTEIEKNRKVHKQSIILLNRAWLQYVCILQSVWERRNLPELQHFPDLPRRESTADVPLLRVLRTVFNGMSHLP